MPGTVNRCPGCRVLPTPDGGFACRTCFKRLPNDLRAAITGGRSDQHAYSQAVVSATMWFRKNPKTAGKP